MGAAVWFSRGRQACFAWLDRLAAPWRRQTTAWNPFREVRGSVLMDMQPFLRMEDYWGAAATLRAHFSGKLPARCFAGLFDEATPAYLLNRLPEERQQIVSQAEAVCQGRFDLLGYEGLTFGDPVDWHLEPVARRRVPLLHWSRIDPYDVATCGDSRIIWALNRHHWLVALGEAYRLSGDPRYAERFEETIRDWIRVNPVGMGINWASSSEAAHRLIAWCWALALFWPASVLTADLLTLMLDELRLHALHIERYLSHGHSSTWALTVEALALFYAGSLFPELRRGERWRRKGQAIFIRQITADLSPGGRCRTPSTSHQRRMIEASLHFVLLADRHGRPVSDELRARVQALLEAALPLRRPDGMMVQVGEADGEWLLPLVPRHRDDWRGLYGVAAVVFGNPQFAWAAGGPTPEVLWLLGTAGAEAFERLSPAPPEGIQSLGLEQGGYVPMRSGWERRSHQLVLDIGAAGDRKYPNSGDLLSIQCSAFGEPIVIDPDLSGAAGHREWQEFVGKTSAHSTLLVDGVAPGTRPSDRLLRSAPGPRAVLRQWSRNERFELADADHDGYRSLPQPVVHRRRVLFVKRAYWIVIDDLHGAGRHRVDLVFQLAAQRAHLDSASLWAKVWTPNGPGLAIKPFAGLALRGDVKDNLGDAGGDPPRRAPARTLSYSAEAEVPIRVVTLLFPLRDEQATIPNVIPFLNDEGRLSGLTIDDPPVTILYSDHSVTVEAA